MSIALWCVFVAAIFPYAFTVLAKTEGRYNNRAPRKYLEERTGKHQRANWVQMNSFEAFPAFAAAVLAAHVTASAGNLVDILAMVFIGARILYGIFYVADKPSLRSLAWFVGFGCMVAIFIIAGVA